jgi:hypothetical protein
MEEEKRRKALFDLGQRLTNHEVEYERVLLQLQHQDTLMREAIHQQEIENARRPYSHNDTNKKNEHQHSASSVHCSPSRRSRSRHRHHPKTQMQRAPSKMQSINGGRSLSPRTPSRAQQPPQPPVWSPSEVALRIEGDKQLQEQQRVYVSLEAEHQKQIAQMQQQFQQYINLSRTTDMSVNIPGSTPGADSSAAVVLPPQPSILFLPETVFENKPEYEEDLGPTIELKMFGRVFVAVFVLCSGTLTSRVTFKAMLATGCMRYAIEYPLTRYMIEPSILPALTQCAWKHTNTPPDRLITVLQECLVSPSDLVQALLECEQYRKFNYSQFFPLFPIVVCCVPLLGLAALVYYHDLPLLHNRRAHIPACYHLMLVPAVLVVTLYYIAQPLSQIVLFFRLYSCSIDIVSEAFINFVPRLLFLLLFWGFLIELIAKLCYSPTSLSLFYLYPLYFTYPKIPVPSKAGGVVVDEDPMQVSDSQDTAPHPTMTAGITIVLALLFVAAVIIISVYVPVQFLQQF